MSVTTSREEVQEVRVRGKKTKKKRKNFLRGSSPLYSLRHKVAIGIAKAAFNKKKALFSSTLDLELRKKLVKCYIWSIALYGAETGTVRAVDQKQLESFELEKISWTDHVRY